jgi:diguanylate cyclase (GGDEF)-like protein
VQAARRSAAQRTAARLRAYPAPGPPDDPTGDDVLLAATRALLTATSRRAVADVLRTAVHDLGGALVPARLAEMNPQALQVDVSLGVGEPLLVVVDPLSMSALRLTRHLPVLVQDALVAAARLDAATAAGERSSVDALTGAATRREIGRRLSEAQVGDAVCMLDLDGFKQLNDSQGHAAGDAALQRFAELLRGCLRPGDLCGRFGGDEFLVVMAAAPIGLAAARMADVVRTWAQSEPGSSASAGVAAVGAAGGAAAFESADRALYGAKRAGRNRVAVAADDDPGEPHE